MGDAGEAEADTLDPTLLLWVVGVVGRLVIIDADDFTGSVAHLGTIDPISESYLHYRFHYVPDDIASRSHGPRGKWVGDGCGIENRKCLSIHSKGILCPASKHSFGENWDR